MTEFPSIKIGNSKRDYGKELDDSFSKLSRYEEDINWNLVELRKKQILKHSKCSFITDVINRLADLIGTKQDNYAEAIVEYCYEELKELHSPVYFQVPINLEPFHKWESWTFADLYDKYIDLAMRKGWEDFYSLRNDFSKNKRETICGLDFDIDYNLIKNYHIVDMLNDLIMNNVICGYELQSFMNPYVENVILKTFNQDCKIEVKLNEKMTFEEHKRELGL